MDEWDNTPIPGYERWDEYPYYLLEDWKKEVANDETRFGYWSWVKDSLYWDEITSQLQKEE